MAKFKNCDSTITFCRNINNIFDFLNTRNFLCKLQYKRPIYLEHEENIKTFIHSSITYLESEFPKKYLNLEFVI